MRDSKALIFIRLLIQRPWTTLQLLSLKRLSRAVSLIVSQPGNFEQIYRRYRDIYLVDVTDQALDSQDTAKGRGDVILFPVIDWNYRFQRPQHFALELSKAGYRVFYLSTTPLIAKTGAGFAIQERPARNVFVVQLRTGSNKHHNFHHGDFSAEEIAEYSNSISSLKASLGISNPIAIVQHPIWFKVIHCTRWSRVVYDCLDYHVGFNEFVSSSLLENEQLLLESADIITVTSEMLRKKVAAKRECVLIRNGSEYSRFSVIERRMNRRPVIGYVGAISHWFDTDLCEEIVKERDGWDFVFVGSCDGANVRRLRGCKNVAFMGEIEYSSIGYYMASFDVCLIPFKKSPLTEATNPVKLYEYLAAGLPVVATDLPELRDLEDVDVYLADTSDQFIKKIENAIRISHDPVRIICRREWASQSDWANRVSDLIRLLA